MRPRCNALACTEDEAALRRALAQAVDLYAGDLLPKLYADWLDSERERLQGLHLQCLERLVHLLEDEGEVADALVYAQRLLRADPLREESYRLLMELHARGGDRAAAVHVYHTCARVLLRELDVDPSPSTHKVYETILNRAESAEVDSAVEERSMQARLVGRQEEWRQLTTAWQSATTGRARLLLITGEAGIGKTRLAEELLDLSGVRAARWRARSPTPRPPRWPMRR